MKLFRILSHDKSTEGITVIDTSFELNKCLKHGYLDIDI